MSHDWQHVAMRGVSAQVRDADSPFALLVLPNRDADVPALAAALAPLLHAHKLNALITAGSASWWVDRIAPEFDPDVTGERHILNAVGPWMESRWNLATQAIALAGFGLGGHGALRLAFKHPQRFRIAASWNGALDFHELHGRGTSLDAIYETKERARHDSAVLQLDPVRWPPHLWFACDPESEWYRGNDRLHEKLAAYGVPHTAELDRPIPLEPMVQFLANGLVQESRRLM